MKKGVLVIFFLIVSKVYSQKYQFECITVENNNRMVLIISDTLCKNTYKDFQIFKILKKEKDKVLESKLSTYDESYNSNLNLQVFFESGEYLIKIKIIYDDKRIYEVEKIISI